MVPIGTLAHLDPADRAAADHALQSLPVRDDRRLARERLQLRPGHGGHGGYRRQDAAGATSAIEWSAMSYQEKITGNLLYYGFALSVLLVYLVLAGQYESWILPLAVISAVPLALLGPVTTLTSLGVDNNLYVQIGLMLLIALSAKNGILIVEVAREHRMIDGKPILEAAVEAARTRFRPILMTSFAFILGVLPLVLATGAGANARRSLGISVFTGMIASTCLAVVFVPAFFVVLQRLQERRDRKKLGKESSRARE